MQKLIIAGVLSTLFLITGCGKISPQVVSNVNIETVTQDNSQWIVTDFKIELGERRVPEMTLPLPMDYGRFRSYKRGESNYLGLDLNMTSILSLPGGVATLPNGQIIPIKLNDVTIIEISISQINGKAYLAFSEGVALVGVAAALKIPEKFSETAMSEFPTYKIGNVDIMAGFFTGGAINSTGFAIFANLGKIWDGQSDEYDSDIFVFEPTQIAESRRLRIFSKLRAALASKVEIEFSQR